MGGLNGLPRRLEEIVGPAHVLAGEAAARYAVDGVRPAVVAAPDSTETVAQVLAAASADRAAVVPWGGGTRMGLGALPRRVDLVLDLSRLNRVLDHEPADLTASVEAGIPLGALQAHLGAQGQFLALDPPRADAGTVGGILATNASGSIRQRDGTPRDLLIGVRVVHADGTITKAGGKVVKNVTGYDMNKLYVGSLGTLGVIVEATFKLAPRPAAERTWAVAFPSPSLAQEAAVRLAGSSLVPTRLELLSREVAAAASGAAGRRWPGGCALAVAFAGVPEAVEAQGERAVAIAKEMGGSEAERWEEAGHAAAWRHIRDFPWGPDEVPFGGVAVKVSVLLTDVAKALDLLGGVGHEAGVALRYVAEAGMGVLRVAFGERDLPPGTDPGRLAKGLESVRGQIAARHGSLVVLEAPAPVKAAMDVWGSVGKALDLMKAIKAQFDPHGILNPGRFVGGI